jgi:hypothetical protein
MSKKNAAAAGYRTLLNGSNGLLRSWNDIHRGKTNLQTGAHEAYQDWKP